MSPIELEVLVGDRLAGWLEISPVPGRRSELVEFEYDPGWLADGFALSPELPLRLGRQRPTLGRSLFGAFQDAAPDRWGQRMIFERARREGLPKGELTEPRRLLLVPDRTRQGALRFRLDGSFLDQSPGSAPWSSLAELERVAADLAEGGDDWGAPDLLLRAGATSGGAQPKAAVDGEDGALWLAKFPQRHAPIDQGRWEQACMGVQREAGIVVAESKVVPVDEYNAIFATRRFDRGAAGERIPFVSFRTMLQLVDAGISGNPSYVELARELRRWSAAPDEDRRELLRRAAVNAALESNDDHMRNFGLLRGPRGWRLSPAFDVNPAPGVRSDTPLVPGGSTEHRDPLELVEHADAFGLSRAGAAREVASAVTAAARLREFAEEAGVDREALSGGAAARLQAKLTELAARARAAESLSTLPTARSTESAASRCTVCGRPLRSAESIARGMGPGCARRA